MVASLRRARGLARLQVQSSAFFPVEVAGHTFRSAVSVLEFDCARSRRRIVSRVLHEAGDRADAHVLVSMVDAPVVVRGTSPAEARFWSLACDAPLPDAAASSALAWPGFTDADGTLVLDRRYEELGDQEQQWVRSQYEAMAPRDEPPFPMAGPRSLYESIAEAQRWLHARGPLVLHADIDANGRVSAVKVMQSPSDAMTTFASGVLTALRFKPAFCAGRPCPMSFPLRLELTPP